MQNDRIIHISVGRSRTSKEWQRTEYLWSEFVERLRTPARTDETVEQYHALPKKEQGRLKALAARMEIELARLPRA